MAKKKQGGLKKSGGPVKARAAAAGPTPPTAPVPPPVNPAVQPTSAAIDRMSKAIAGLKNPKLAAIMALLIHDGISRTAVQIAADLPGFNMSALEVKMLCEFLADPDVDLVFITATNPPKYEAVSPSS